MRAFTCGHCGQLVFFQNSLCLRCHTALGFVPWERTLATLEPGSPEDALRRCANMTLASCNWLLEDDEPGVLCRSCRLTRTRPNDADGVGLAGFAEAEGAKRRVLFQLMDLGLPIEHDGLQFDLLSSSAGPVTTGHEDGLITIDLAESDDARREARRAQLGEPYRTLVGHFRHEIGHYYWPLLVERTPALERYRELFGDEREDYGEAIDRHYDQGPPRDWADRYVSEYATMHSWEDWAETWSHLLHIRDTLQTAASYGLLVTGPAVAHGDATFISAPSDADAGDTRELLSEWLPLTYALNAVNRSMGKDDLYPFTIAPAVARKLAFVNERVGATAETPAPVG